MNQPILVAGATGGLGRHLVQQLKARDYRVWALVRDETRASQLLGADVELVVGDTRHYQTLPPAAAGVRQLICATGTHQFEGPNSPKHVDYEGVCHLAKAAAEAEIGHFVLVSSIGVTRPDHPLNKLGQVLTWKLKGETCLRASGIPYTIVRPGGLTDDPGGQQAIQISQGDKINGRIGRADVATVCIEALHHPEARNKTIEVIATPGSPPEDWRALFADLD